MLFPWLSIKIVENWLHSEELIFIVSGHVAPGVAACIALGSIPGGYVGGHWARRLPDAVLRGLVVIVGVSATVYLFGFR